MNTKIIMTGTSFILGLAGILITFTPDTVLSSLNIEENRASVLMVQIIGGLYFGYGMLNWMVKGSLIGGIYNRPIAVANISHFSIAGLAILKGLKSNPELPVILWATGAVYLLLGLLFAIILFRHPINSQVNAE
jgi:hypothetical protein